ncbi:hypothetical protein NQZ68_018739 [Dissostichus eleginoides]|nr:hypothetical protein NQZ68_018739 [Dissostichus eleginoides]
MNAHTNAAPDTSPSIISVRTSRLRSLRCALTHKSQTLSLGVQQIVFLLRWHTARYYSLSRYGTGKETGHCVWQGGRESLQWIHRALQQLSTLMNMDAARPLRKAVMSDTTAAWAHFCRQIPQQP